MIEIHWCRRCHETTEHKSGEHTVRCTPCGLLSTRSCTHDLVESGYCTDCNRAI